MSYLRKNLSTLLSALASSILLCVCLHAQQLDTSLYIGMKWRSIGPFRAGRVSAVAGIPAQA
jgi:hypothetical protein